MAMDGLYASNAGAVAGDPHHCFCGIGAERVGGGGLEERIGAEPDRETGAAERTGATERAGATGCGATITRGEEARGMPASAFTLGPMDDCGYAGWARNIVAASGACTVSRRINALREARSRSTRWPRRTPG